MQNENPALLTPQIASDFADLALANLVREFPNAPGHIVTSADDWKSPRQWHPIFFGCFDWHSAVHGYWLLARICRLFPNLPRQVDVIAHFDAFVTPDNVSTEIAYFHRPQARTYERPYGWAWLLMLCAELQLLGSKDAQRWESALRPLAQLIRDRFLEFFAKANYPIRAGTHGNIAFALVLARQYAVLHDDPPLLTGIEDKARQWFGNDRDCQVWEPSLTDFLSPALMEAECMRLVLPAAEYHIWLPQFLPGLSIGQPAVLFEPAAPTDRTDGQITHLDGLNFSRAWCFNGIAEAFGPGDPTRQLLQQAAQRHVAASFGHISGHYAGEHWLATFALLAVS